MEGYSGITDAVRWREHPGPDEVKLGVALMMRAACTVDGDRQNKNLN